MVNVLIFGTFFKQKRMALGGTLREFCRKNELDPGNISKLERGRLTPPQNEGVLKKYADCLRLNSSDWETFKELAQVGSGRIPEYLTDEETLAKLPMFFRAIKDSDLNEEKLRQLVEMIRKS